MKKGTLCVNLFLLFVSLSIALVGAEVFMHYRESRITSRDVQWLKDSNIDRLFGRSAGEPLRVRFFNGCFIDARLLKADPDLGYLNTPNSQGYSIRVFGRTNLVVPKPFDLSIFSRSGLRIQAASFRINSLGNRGPEMPRVKPAQTRRLIFLGDSVTFGYYVEEEDTFVSRVGRELSALVPAAYRIETVNAGVSSLNAHQILYHLRQRALAWSADVIFWDFYANDILKTGGQEADVLFPVRRLGWMSFLKKSATGRFLGNAIFSSRPAANLGIVYEDPVNRLVQEAWEKTEKDVSEGYRLLKERNIPMVVVIFPSALQLARPWTAPHYQGRLKKLCLEHGIPCIDLLPDFVKAGPADKFYYSGDAIHPNANGHTLAAAQIIKFLKQNPDILRLTG